MKKTIEIDVDGIHCGEDCKKDYDENRVKCVLFCENLVWDWRNEAAERCDLCLDAVKE
jgi:hypothetical protein